MNKSLTALATKLSWQLKEINQLLEELTQELNALQKKLAAKREQIHQACAIPANINPEQEIARLNFIIRSQQEQDSLRLDEKGLQTRQTQLKEQQIRLNTELKMIEKYQSKQQKLEQQKNLVTEQNASDEWILQRSLQHENQ